MATKKEEKLAINITPLKIKMTKIRIVGDSPLIIHAWSEKAKKQMLEAFRRKYERYQELSDVFEAINGFKAVIE